ncbi:MAG: acetylxylan esterase [Flaviflexus sp.]|uniref:acetylxylan esterase n=1 Tax=Flaviflexus sp. TaxID=1969482 RepID=UPI003F8DE654
MAFFDYSLDQLRTYRPDVTEPADFDRFWLDTLSEHPANPEPLERTVCAPHLERLIVEDLSICGFGKMPVKAWFIRPRESSKPLPIVVSFVGYGGGRGLPEEHLHWASAGFAELVVDSRGQGAQWGGGGDTPDIGTIQPSIPGHMTRGIHDPSEYYYRRLYTDAANAIETAQHLDGIDPGLLVTAGGSQGGALALVSATLAGMRGTPVTATIADVPFLANFERAIGLTDAYPYAEITDYLAIKKNMVDQVFETLSYFDVVNFSKRARGRALFSTGLMDPVAPPSTVFASHNWFAGQAEMEVYRFNAHAGGGIVHTSHAIRWLQGILRKG